MDFPKSGISSWFKLFDFLQMLNVWKIDLHLCYIWSIFDGKRRWIYHTLSVWLVGKFSPKTPRQHSTSDWCLPPSLPNHLNKHVGWSRVSLYCIDVYVYYFFRYTVYLSFSWQKRAEFVRNDPKQAGFQNLPAIDGPIKHKRSECWPYMNHCAQTRCSWLSAGSINQKWESIFTLKWHTVGRNPAANRQEDLWRFAGFYTSQVPNIFL